MDYHVVSTEKIVYLEFYPTNNVIKHVYTQHVWVYYK